MNKLFVWKMNFKKTDQPPESSQSLMSAMGQRSTYRGGYRESSMSPDQVLSLQSLAKAGTGIHVISNQEATKDFVAFIRTSEMYMWFQDKAAKEFLSVVRFDSKKPTSEERGIPSTQLGVKAPDLFFLRLFRIFPWIVQLLVRIPLLNLPIVHGINKRLHRAHYLLVTASSVEPMSLIAAGQSAMAAWLELENRGFKAQPMSSASITLLDAETGSLPKDTHPRFQRLFNAEGPEIIKKQFRLEGDTHVIWLFRFGVPE